MQRIIAGLIAAALLLSLTQSADSLGIGREGRGFGRLGSQNNKKAGAAPVGCSQTGVFDLTNTCNIAYVL